MRLINPTRAEERIVALYRKEEGDADDIFNTAVDAAQTIILDLYDNEAIEAEPIKHGKWVLNMQGNWACSLCGNDPYHDNMKNMNYCPKCGARMDGEEREKKNERSD